MFRLLFHKGNQKQHCEPKVRGVQAEHSSVVWDAPIDYDAAKQFVDDLNETKLSEDALFDAAWEFLMNQSDASALEVPLPDIRSGGKD